MTVVRRLSSVRLCAPVTVEIPCSLPYSTVGEQISKIGPLLTAELDGALLNDVEWLQWKKIMRGKQSMHKKIAKLEQMFDDGFEEWVDPESLSHEGHGH